MVTLEDISLEVGCSVNTVSKALNNKPDVSKDMRRRVLEAANKLGYIPNTLAKSLVTRESLTVGIVLPNLERPTHALLLEKLTVRLRERNYHSFLGVSRNDAEQEQREVENLCQKRIDGLLAVPVGSSFPALEYLSRFAIPAVFLLKPVDNPAASFVAVAPESEARAAVGHLLAAGCRRLAVVGAEPQSAPWLKACAGCLAESGLPLDPRLVVAGEPTWEGGYHAAGTIIARFPDIDGMILACDGMFGGVHRALELAGLDCPGRVKVVACRDSRLEEFFQIPLTTCSANLDNMAARATELLISRIKDKTIVEPERIFECPELTVRESSAGKM